MARIDAESAGIVVAFYGGKRARWKRDEQGRAERVARTNMDEQKGR